MSETAPLSAPLYDWCEVCRHSCADLDTHTCSKRRRITQPREEDAHEPAQVTPAGREVAADGEDHDTIEETKGAAADTHPAAASQAPVVELEPGAKTLGPGIHESGPESWEDHIEAWHSVKGAVERATWYRADVAASVKRLFKRAGLEKFAEQIGCASSTVYQLARLAERFPSDSRRLESSVWLHVEALKAKGRAAEVLDQAIGEGLSVRALRERLQGPRKLPAKDAAAELADQAEAAQAQPPALPNLKMLARLLVTQHTRAEVEQFIRWLSGLQAKDEAAPVEEDA